MYSTASLRLDFGSCKPFLPLYSPVYTLLFTLLLLYLQPFVQIFIQAFLQICSSISSDLCSSLLHCETLELYTNYECNNNKKVDYSFLVFISIYYKGDTPTFNSRGFKGVHFYEEKYIKKL